MKRIIFLSLLFLIGLTIGCNQGGNSNTQQNFGPGGGMRQGNFDPEEMAAQQVEQMKELLELSKDQEKQMYDLTIENFESMQKAREEMQQSGGGFEGMREQMQQMREEQDKKIKEILSEEQWGKYETYQEEMRARRGQGGGGFPRN